MDKLSDYNEAYAAHWFNVFGKTEIEIIKWINSQDVVQN